MVINISLALENSIIIQPNLIPLHNIIMDVGTQITLHLVTHMILINKIN